MTSQPPPDRSSTGWDPHFIAALSYLFGCISAVLVLTVEKKSRFVRFHAMQSLITFLGVLVAAMLIGSLPLVASLAYVLFVVAVAVLWVFLMFKALNGVLYKLPYIGDMAEQRVP